MIKNIKIFPNKIKVFFANRINDSFLNIWLRDHAKDKGSWDSRSNQRKTFTAKINPKISVKNIKIRDFGNSVDVFWSDLKKPINYKSSFLLENTIKKKKIKNPNSLCLWTADKIKKDIYIDFKNATSKKGFKILLKNLHKYGFSVIENCEKKMISVEKIAKKIGYVRESIFGGLWSFESNKNMADSAYTQDELRPHTDATYSNDAPGLQLLLCCHYDAMGGESIMVDGFKIAEKIKKEDKALYKLLTDIEVKGEYKGDGVYLEAKRPIFKLNKENKLVQVSFNNYDRAPFRLNDKKTLKFYDAIRKFDLIANDKKFQWRHVLKPGELLIFNNWRILHGRGSFNGARKISGCYINKEDFDSSCRMNKII